MVGGPHTYLGTVVCAAYSVALCCSVVYAAKAGQPLRPASAVHQRLTSLHVFCIAAGAQLPVAAPRCPMSPERGALSDHLQINKADAKASGGCCTAREPTDAVDCHFVCGGLQGPCGSHVPPLAATCSVGGASGCSVAHHIQSCALLNCALLAADCTAITCTWAAQPQLSCANCKLPNTHRYGEGYCNLHTAVQQLLVQSH